MDDTQLSRMSLVELRALQEELHSTIRAAIRAKREAKEAAQIGHKPRPPVSEQPEPEPFSVSDLARERDAWLSRRRAGPVTS